MRLGVAQLVARYLGVVEAASSSLVTQTRKDLENIEFSRSFLLLVTQFFMGCYTICYADLCNTLLFVAAFIHTLRYAIVSGL